MNSDSKQTCLYCHDSFRGRSDKKFCDDKCRNAFYNDCNRQENNLMRNITNILKRNRRVLRELLNGKSVASFHKSYLINTGFQLDYHTHSLVNKRGNRIFYCFEYGYQLTAKNNIKLIYHNNLKS